MQLCLYPDATAQASQIQPLQRDPTSGAWSAVLPASAAATYYRFAVTVHVPGVGLVRNLVTDPYSLSLSGDSRRSYVADLNSERFKPAGWDASHPPETVSVSPDMSIYELHVRDKSDLPPPE